MPPLVTLPASPAVHRRDLPVLLAALLAVLAWDASGLDLAVMRLLGDAGGFPLRQAWWTRSLLHDGGRGLGWMLLALLAFDAWRPLLAGPSRAERCRWLAVTLAAALLVPGLKRISRTSCPWDLAEFGAQAATPVLHVSHWAWGVFDGGAGHCFPSGHAAGAFCFLSGYFLLRAHRPRLARVWLAGTLLAGVLFGLAQTLRGAHYPSHTLWSAWLCAALCVAAQRSATASAAYSTSGAIALPISTIDATRSGS